MDTAVSLVVTADLSATRAVAETLFPEAALHALAPPEWRPRVPFEGELFAILGAQPRGACIGLVVPVVLTAAAPSVPGRSSVSSPPVAALVAVDDHVNLALWSPLCGRWPAGMDRTFPALSGIYQPARVRSRAGARVYFTGVVAGVANAERLTPFEGQVLRDQRYGAVADTLVPAAIIAAHYGLTLAACGVPWGDDGDGGRGKT